VVPTFRSVAIHFDPLTADVSEISAALLDSAALAPVRKTGRRHEIAVSYGGEDGPDLGEVADWAHLTPAQVVERHVATSYRVYMLGFQPGFAYLGLVDQAIAMPRRDTPRLRVAAGSVGIAGRQTGIYPGPSPGGWRIIGRALEPVFDPARTLGARFAPGDTVAFIPSARRGDTVGSDAMSIAPAPEGRRVTVIRPGLFTTIQDSGHWGDQAFGVPVGGAMDASSHAMANVAVGNNRQAPTLEATIVGPELRLEQETTIAVAGADLSATLDGRTVPLQTPVLGHPGGVLRFGPRVAGARAYVAFDGGLAECRRPATPVAAGEVLGLGPAGSSAGGAMASRRPLPSGGVRVRVMPGPQDGEVPQACLEGLLSTRFVVSSQSNRMGYRLSGDILPSGPGEMISDATFAGAIQVPPSGQPIILLADRQTTGGYPQVATIITADLPLVAQLAPGDWIEFAACSRRDALAALVAQEAIVRDGR
jgi:KipI family sensor histidine kinase inhibitor